MTCPIPDHLVAAYREEAGGLVSEFEEALLALERSPGDVDLIDQAYRALHTVRGSAAMFSLDDLAAFSPDVEAVLDAVRDGWIRVTPELVALLLEAKDTLRALLRGDRADEAGRARLVEALRARLPTQQTVLPAGPPLPPPTPSPEGRKTFRLRFRPHPDLFQNGASVLGLLGELRSLGRYRAVARTEALPRLEELSPETCYLGCDVILTTDRGLTAVLDAFTFLDGRCELKVEVVDDERAPGTEPDVRLGKILVDRGEISPEAVDRVVARRQRIGEILEAEGLVSAEAIEAAVVEQAAVREERQRRGGTAPGDGASRLRAASSRLDELLDLTGELVIAQARLVRLASHARPELVRVSDDIERLLAVLRQGILEVRKLSQP